MVLKADLASSAVFTTCQALHDKLGIYTLTPEEEAFAGFRHHMILLSIYFMPRSDLNTEDRLRSKEDKHLPSGSSCLGLQKDKGLHGLNAFV
jgi:hypothetical protein